MDKLSTYNRVRDLEAPWILQGYNVSYGVLLTFITAGSLWLWQSSNPWPYIVHSLLIAMGIFAALRCIQHYRLSRCQFCGSALTEITRPLILTQKFLSLNGTKQGDYFYTEHTPFLMPFSKRWIKISSRSLACHHCRLTEEKCREHYENIGDDEVNSIEQKKN
jgi:hypothetical protein